VGGEIVLLQLGLAPLTISSERRPILDALRDPLAVALARLVRRASGALGEKLVLPWAVAAPRLVARLLDEEPPAEAEAEPLAAALAAQVWGDGVSDATSVLSELRGASPDAALRRIAALPEPDRETARRVVAAFKAAKPLERLGRSGMDRWEPFSAAVAMANGKPRQGVAAAGGIGAGRMAWVPDLGSARAFRPRDVLVAPRPLPQLAPLLWDAAGVATLGGGPGAHLMESARALGIPAVTGVTLPTDERLCIALDGWTGEVYATPW
jgi:hypothetical protein